MIALIEVALRILNAQSSTSIVEIFVPESLGVVKNATRVTIQQLTTDHQTALDIGYVYIYVLALHLLKFV